VKNGAVKQCERTLDLFFFEKCPTEILKGDWILGAVVHLLSGDGLTSRLLP
jgi:hypothetical protein